MAEPQAILRVCHDDNKICTIQRHFHDDKSVVVVVVVVEWHLLTS